MLHRLVTSITGYVLQTVYVLQTGYVFQTGNVLHRLVTCYTDWSNVVWCNLYMLTADI